MKLEETVEPLQSLGKWLFQFIRGLGGANGAEPIYQEGSGWYRAPPRGKVCLYLYFAGPRGRKRPNSVLLTTLWTDEFETLPWVERGNNWFGSVSADFYARPEDPNVRKRAEDFVRRAFKVVAVATLVKGGQLGDTKQVAEAIEKVTRGDSQAVAAAERIREWLGKVGVVTAKAVRDILINVASEAVKKVLMG